MFNTLVTRNNFRSFMFRSRKGVALIHIGFPGFLESDAVHIITEQMAGEEEFKNVKFGCVNGKSDVALLAKLRPAKLPYVVAYAGGRKVGELAGEEVTDDAVRALAREALAELAAANENK